MNNPLGLTKNFVAKGDIGSYRLAAFTDTEHEAKSATGPADKVVGATGVAGAKRGERIDVHLSGLHTLLAGGDFAPGDWLTADAEGRAVKAGGGTVMTVGRAVEEGELGVLALALINPQLITT